MRAPGGEATRRPHPAAPVAERPPAASPPDPSRDSLAAVAHGLSATEVAARAAVDPAIGLSTASVRARQAEIGPNELEPPRRVSLLASIVDAATEPFVIMLGLAGLLALVVGETRDGLLVLIGLIPIVGADVVTEFRAERALEALREAAAPRAHVRRDGRVVEVEARELVPGDIVVLRVGDIVPADLRLVRSHALSLDRSILTGESLPEEASVAADAPATVLADRRSMAWSGTAAVLGRGEGIVVATGRDTEIGRIAKGLAPGDRGRSPLQRELDRLVRIMLVVAGGLIVVTVGLGLARGAPLGEAILAGISAAIAAIPEEPPILLAVVLGLGAFRLLRRGVLVRRLNAQETLGAIDLIITDKTGTLTENRLRLQAVLSPDGPVEAEPARSILVGDALRAEEDAWDAAAGARIGSFTGALTGALADPPRLVPADLLDARPPGDREPYSRTRARRNGGIEELVIGAPEAVLDLVASRDGEAARWHALIDRSAGAGRRLLLLAGRPDEGQWQVRGLFAFADELRPGIREAARTATEAGIQTLIVTGDHPTTAASIARQAGLPADRIATGPDLDAMTDDELADRLGRLDIVARATPEQKLRLVVAARAAGRTVAVTGDGVNDAPALQRADVAVAMGSGTAVAREAADLVLGDDSFVTLMEGLREGRRIVANVQKGLVFLTSTHVALLGFILVGTLVGIGQPLLPIQILWLELFIDISSSVAFEREPEEPGAMTRPPRPRTRPLLPPGLLVRIALAGSVTALAALALMTLRGEGADHARWLAFNALVFGQLVRAWANRSLDAPVTSLPPNGFLAVACLLAAAAQLAIPYVPALSDAFRATRLGALDLALVALVALGPAIVAELVRARRRVVWLA